MARAYIRELGPSPTSSPFPLKAFPDWAQSIEEYQHFPECAAALRCDAMRQEIWALVERFPEF